jgi:hydroxymethylpyrimidine pyrophosphatase-like HAD family hydrolase
VSILLACDLDGTLIYSRRRAGVDVPEKDLVCVEQLDGRPVSYVTSAALAGIHELNRAAEVVAVTARSTAQFQRVTLPLSRRYAVLANGGLLLDHGVADVAWSAGVTRRLRGVAPLAEVLHRVESVCDAAWTRKVTVVESLFCCAVVDSHALPPTFVADEQDWAQRHGWRVSLQGSKFYVVPQPLEKAVAVAEVARRVGATTVFAAGDAALDADLLRAADRGVHPSAGELAAEGWSAASVTRVPAGGVLGGEQIVDWLRAQVSGVAGDAAAESPTSPARPRTGRPAEARTAGVPQGAMD